MIPISEATKIVLENAPSLSVETVDLPASIGRVLAEDVTADMDMPPFDRSQMDGFAVKQKDVEAAPTRLRIVGESVAGKRWKGVLSSGEAVRIMTGAPVPEGADSVQKVEETSEQDGVINILKPTKPLQNIVKKGAEINGGEVILKKGEIITDKMVATLAAFGYAKVSVSTRPKVAILATGSEIVDIGQKPSEDQIRNSNSWMLKAFAEKFADVEVLPIAVDDLEGLKATIKSAVEKCDCLLISGGVSVGDYDFTKPALRELGAEIFFEKVALKPGKPTVYAKLDKTTIFGLPGNPVSIAVTFFVFVRIALLKMQKTRTVELKRGFAKTSHKIKGAKGRDSLLPVLLSTTGKGRLKIESLRFSGSSNFIAFANANALVFVPRDTKLGRGEVAEIRFI